MDIGYYQQLALRAEREKLDAIFFADSPSLAESGREGLRIRFEPVTWLAAIAAVTDQVASQKRCQVTVSSEQLQSQQRFFTPASMTLGESLSWPIEYKDEYSLGLYANSQYGL